MGGFLFSFSKQSAESPIERTGSREAWNTFRPKDGAVLGYTPTYYVNVAIRTHLESVVGSVGLLLE